MIVLGIDPGLASFGTAVVERGDAVADVRVRRADVFESAPSARKKAVASSDDRFRRARALAAWLAALVEESRPDAIALEAMSWPRGAHAISAIALSWGVVAVLVGERPTVQAGPREWRDALLGRRATEAEAHEVVSRVHGCADAVAAMPKRLRVHAMDAAGVALWSLRTDVVRAVGGRGAR